MKPKQSFGFILNFSSFLALTDLCLPTKLCLTAAVDRQTSMSFSLYLVFTAVAVEIYDAGNILTALEGYFNKREGGDSVWTSSGHRRTREAALLPWSWRQNDKRARPKHVWIRENVWDQRSMSWSEKKMCEMVGRNHTALMCVGLSLKLFLWPFSFKLYCTATLRRIVMKVVFSTHRKKQICALIICRQCNGERIIVHTETGSILLIGQYDSGGVLSCWQPPSWNWGRPVLGKNI